MRTAVIPADVDPERAGFHRQPLKREVFAPLDRRNDGLHAAQQVDKAIILGIKQQLLSLLLALLAVLFLKKAGHLDAGGAH